ncbi:hypothetical protein D3C78_920860 [compost metagenome]
MIQQQMIRLQIAINNRLWPSTMQVVQNTAYLNGQLKDSLLLHDTSRASKARFYCLSLNIIRNEASSGMLIAGRQIINKSRDKWMIELYQNIKLPIAAAARMLLVPLYNPKLAPKPRILRQINDGLHAAAKLPKDAISFVQNVFLMNQRQMAKAGFCNRSR